MDFNIIDETKRYHTIYNIKEETEGFKLTDDLEIHYIELKKFEKQMKKGTLKRAREMAKELLKDGMDIDLIAKYTKLSIEEIKEIKEIKGIER